jgi:glycosyltransferase involved in cell wall biosynthesis
LNTEVIVVDDGSRDGSLDVIKEFDGEISWFSISHRGPSAARNAGLRAAKGEWIQFLDADDLLHLDKLNVSISATKDHPEVEFVWAPHLSVGQGFSVHDVKQLNCSDTEIVISQDALLAHYAPATAVFRRTFLARVGGWNESLNRWVDLEYHARIAALIPRYMRLNNPLYFYRQHSGERISNSNRDHTDIQGAIESLSFARRALENSKITPSLWKSFLWTFYLHLARSAAVSGDCKKFSNLIHEAMKLRGSRKFRVKSYLAMVAVHVFGLRLTSVLIERVLRYRNSRKRVIGFV